MKRVWKNKSILLDLIMVLIVALSAVFAEVLSPGNPVRIDMGHRFEAPSEIFPLGTDGFGRCVLSRLLYGARYSLGLAVLVMLILAFAVIPSAMAAAYKGGFMEKGFLWLCDISMALPPIVLVLAITGILGNGPINLLFSSFFSYFGWYGRMVRSHTLTELSKSYTTYAITGGSSAASLLGIQVFPNIAPNLLVLFCLGIGDMILTLSATDNLAVMDLSFEIINPNMEASKTYSKGCTSGGSSGCCTAICSGGCKPMVDSSFEAWESLHTLL